LIFFFSLFLDPREARTVVSESLSMKISSFFCILDFDRTRVVVSKDLLIKNSFFCFIFRSMPSMVSDIELLLRLVAVKLQIHLEDELTGSCGNE
jgi:hypothetical protein